MMSLANQFNRLKKAINRRFFESQLESIEQVSSIVDFQRIIAIERYRVNRNGGSFALLVFKLEKGQMELNVLLKLVKEIYKRARISDQLGWYGHQYLGLILPQTSALGAQKFLTDLYSQNRNGMPRPPVDLFTYPFQIGYISA